MLMSGAPSIRQNALRSPPSSSIAMICGTPSDLALATATSTIFAAASALTQRFWKVFSIAFLRFALSISQLDSLAAVYKRSVWRDARRYPLCAKKFYIRGSPVIGAAPNSRECEGTMAKARAVVQVGDRRFEIQHFDLPKIGAEDALMRVEACGICGSDVDQYDGKLNGMGLKLPVIPGHEPVGIIEEIGALASRRWGVQAGDRVAVEPVLGCGHCRACMTGNYRRCRVGRPGTAIAACGFVPIHIAPALWGGMAEYMYLDPNVALHKLSREVPAELAALYQPIAAGISWAHREPGTRVGDTVVVFGAGQRGLACVVAAREAGAAQVMVIARRQSAHRLNLAAELGADVTIFAEED